MAHRAFSENISRLITFASFLDAKRNGIFIDGTGSGKTHLFIAIAAWVIRARARGWFYNLIDLVNQLEQEKAVGGGATLEFG